MSDTLTEQSSTALLIRINAAAYWDYQWSKVYVRTSKTIRRSLERTAKPINGVTVEKEIKVDDELESCSRCGASKWWVLHGSRSYVVFDLKFSHRGIRRWAVRYRYNRYRCSACRAERTMHLRYSKYGPNLRAYVTYLLIEMRLSHRRIGEEVGSSACL
jgi:hypothetical protein